jgi:F-box/leucine-rich repeat protein 10/11
MHRADVATQSSLVGWTLGKWANYYSCEPSAREKVRNVISLEISGTKLGDQVMPPKLVREMDWVEKFWPNNKKNASHPYPKVQLYCLMGVAGAWTVSVHRSIAHSLLTILLGLAHRLCWVICVLSHT